jgi:NAD-dependent deacetylase
MADVGDARELLAAAQRVVVLTGAGISTDSGLPDFRGPDGLWTRDPAAEKASHISTYLTDPAVRERAWRRRAEAGTDRPEPNSGHQAVVTLERSGRLLLLVTQNVDGLHHDAGSDPARIVEVHGTTREFGCLECGARGPMEEVLARVRAGEADPPCLDCGGLLKSATISFGQNLLPADLERCFAAARACDLLLAVGTTLGVYPVADLVPTAASHGAAVIIVNGSPTAMDDLADVVVRGSISEVLPEVVGVQPPAA